MKIVENADKLFNMGFIVKLENIINALLFKLQNLLKALASKLTPNFIKKIILFLSTGMRLFIAGLKNLPTTSKIAGLKILNKIKGHLAAYNFKTKLQESYKVAIENYKKNKPSENLTKTKKILLSPFILLGEWLNGLSTIQSLALLSLTATSVLAVLSIFFEGHRLLNQRSDVDRSPASVEEVTYDRPSYYKRQTRFFELNHIRLPIYSPQVNEIQSIDIDFVATMSNRSSKQKIQKLELQLRDFLIFEIEPVVASFPLEEEGKEVIRQKLIQELNQFLKNHQINGTVEELEIIYILAN